MSNMATLKSAKAQLAPLGVTLAKLYGNEYRVRLKGAPAGEGYFTDDLDDAIATGKEMAKQRKEGK